MTHYTITWKLDDHQKAMGMLKRRGIWSGNVRVSVATKTCSMAGRYAGVLMLPPIFDVSRG